MESFLNSEEYKTLKAKYEKEYFKLFGEYCWYDGDKIEKKSASNIKEYFKNKKVNIEYVEEQITKKGTKTSITRNMSKSFYDIWSEDPEMKEYKEIIFNCDVEKVKEHQFNLFTGFNHLENIKDENVDLYPVFEHIKTLTNYNNEHYEYFINWLAQLVQQPHILPHTAIIIISEEGIGKDIFNTFLESVLNEKYTSNTEKLELICGKFNTILGGKLLMTINETNPVDSRERIENIKYLITAEKIMIEGKHKEPIKTTNYCRFIFFSNRLFAFPVEEGSRRPVIFNASSKYLKDNIGIEENKKYFTNLIKVFKDKRYQKAFLNFLLNRDISKFNPQNIVKSELHKTLEENSVSPIVGFLANLCNKNINQEGKNIRILTKEALKSFSEYMRDNNYKFDYSQAKFNVELETKYNIRKLKTGGNQYFEFDILNLKKMLESKYNYDFSKKENIEIDDDDDEISPLDHGITDEKQEIIKKQKAEIEELKKQLAEAQRIIKELQEKKETPQSDEELEKELQELTKAPKQDNEDNDFEEDIKNFFDLIG